MTTLRLATTKSVFDKVDAVVIGLIEGPKGLALAPGSDAVSAAMGRGLLPALSALGATGKKEQVTLLATLGGMRPSVVAAVGLGPQAESRTNEEGLRRAAGAAIRALAGTKSVAVLLAAENPELMRPVAEGALLGAYAFTRYRVASAPDHKVPVQEIVLPVANAKDKATKAAARRAELVATATAFVRDLVNVPGCDLYPADLADAARAECRRVGLDVEVLEEKALTKGRFGGILGVGQGSEHPPRLVHISYRSKGAKTSVALIGKGITFDSGGLSLKPPTAMEDMKLDMAGAAAVIATMSVAAELGLNINADAWVPMAENMPSGAALRPSDVITLRGGTKVEVNNTDAEGRLILADALARAAEDHPDVMVDVATLTGAALVALGTRTTGVMANDDELREQVLDAAGRAGEHMWPMPLPADLRKGLDSEIADLVNTGPREGGMLTAGIFLREFVPEGIRWAHLDIAGPAYNMGEPFGYTPYGGTGAAVRTLVQLLEDLAAGP